jgi:hypothetical protein
VKFSHRIASHAMRSVRDSRAAGKPTRIKAAAVSTKLAMTQAIWIA